MIARPQAAAAVGRVRPFRPDDLPDVVGLRRRLFRFTERPSPAELADYCERVFCRNPWSDDELPSLVHEDEHGKLVGFLGVVPRRMIFQDEPIRVAIATQLMVSPERRGLAGRRLVRAFLAGPQDLSMSDLGNDATRLLWESLGGSVSVTHSVTWEKALRPCRLAVSRLGGGALRRGAALAAQPLVALGDVLAAAWPGAQNRPSGGDTVPLAPATLAATADELLRAFTLRPEYHDDSLDWLLARRRKSMSLAIWQAAWCANPTALWPAGSYTTSSPGARARCCSSRDGRRGARWCWRICWRTRDAAAPSPSPGGSSPRGCPSSRPRAARCGTTGRGCCTTRAGRRSPLRSNAAMRSCRVSMGSGGSASDPVVTRRGSASSRTR